MSNKAYILEKITLVFKKFEEVIKMKYIKSLVISFAVFASILMLSTTCIAAPIQESVSIESFDDAEQDMSSSFESIVLRMDSDRYLNYLVAKISSDPAIGSILSSIESSNDMDEIVSLADSYVNVLESKAEFTYLTSYLERCYSRDVETISDGFSELLTDSEDACAPDWPGFVRNMNGDILTPDGWISPDDPDYDDWLAVEKVIMSGVLGLQGVLAILLIIWLLVINIVQFASILAWLLVRGPRHGLILDPVTAAIIALIYTIVIPP